jgi:type II secretion system protein C
VHVIGVLLVIHFATEAIGAYGQVRLFAVQDVKIPLARADEADARSAKVEPHSAKARLDAVVADLDAYNPFCPGCIDESAPDATIGPDGAIAQAGVPLDPASPELWVKWSDGTVLGRRLQPGEPETELPLTLLATMQAEPRHLSMATIERGEAGQAGLFSVGEEVMPGVAIHTIGSGVVHLSNSGSVEYLALEERHKPPAKAAKKKKPKKKKKKKKKKPKHAIPGAQDAVKCDSATSCVIERAFVNKLIAKPALLAKQVRLRPSRKDDEMQGYKLYGVRKGSVPQLLKLRNGDLVKSINGKPLDSMDAAMNMYQQLRNASHLRITVDRRGKALEMNYDIR